MKTINEKTIYELEIKKSKFISILLPIHTREALEDCLNNIKDEYKSATHYCYAYIVDNNQKYSDDGEPIGTAGMPILNILQKEQMNHVLCVVVRYFGGIKLGSGGLIRSYAKATKEAIKKANLINLNKGLEITLTFPYDNQKQIDYLLKDILIINKNYDAHIIYTIHIAEKSYEDIKKQLLTLAELSINKEVFI